MNQPDPNQQPFNQDYFSSGPYAEVNFARYSQYWWSNRYYAWLARRYGPPRGRVLELGCGMGHLLGWLTDRYQVFGSDINPWALSQAKRNVPDGQFVLLSADDICVFPQAVFDVVIAKHVVEHLSQPEQAIAEMSRVLKPGGLLILATPNLSSPMRKRKKDAWIGYKDPTHISLKPPEEWLACPAPAWAATAQGLLGRVLGCALLFQSSQPACKSCSSACRGACKLFLDGVLFPSVWVKA